MRDTSRSLGLANIVGSGLRMSFRSNVSASSGVPTGGCLKKFDPPRPPNGCGLARKCPLFVFFPAASKAAILAPERPQLAGGPWCLTSY